MSELVYEYEAGEEPVVNIKDLQDEIISLKEENLKLVAELEVARLRVLACERFNLRVAERADELQRALGELMEYTGVSEVPKPPLKTRPNAKRFGGSSSGV